MDPPVYFAPDGAPHFNGEGIFVTGSALLDILGLDGLRGEGCQRGLIVLLEVSFQFCQQLQCFKGSHRVNI